MTEATVLDEQRPGQFAEATKVDSVSEGHIDLWPIVLAGGEGVRLRPLGRRAFRDDRPKQYARLLGPRSLLGQTLGARASLRAAHSAGGGLGAKQRVTHPFFPCKSYRSRFLAVLMAEANQLGGLLDTFETGRR